MGLYDEVEIEDMDWNEDMQAFTYQCPCGDLFQITLVRYRALPWCCADDDLLREEPCSLDLAST